MQDNGRLTYNIAEVGRILGLSRGAAYIAAKNGSIPCIKIGRRLLVPKVQLQRLLQGGDNLRNEGEHDA